MKSDDENKTTQNGIKLGIVSSVVGFATLKPSEFVIVLIRQRLGTTGVW